MPDLTCMPLGSQVASTPRRRFRGPQRPLGICSQDLGVWETAEECVRVFDVAQLYNALHGIAGYRLDKAGFPGQQGVVRWSAAADAAAASRTQAATLLPGALPTTAAAPPPLRLQPKKLRFNFPDAGYVRDAALSELLLSMPSAAYLEALAFIRHDLIREGPPPKRQRVHAGGSAGGGTGPAPRPAAVRWGGVGLRDRAGWHSVRLLYSL